MADTTTRSTQEAGKTPGEESGSIRNTGSGGMAGGQHGQSTGGSGGSAMKQARDVTTEEQRQSSSGTWRGTESASEMVDQAKRTVNDAYQKASKSVNESYEQAMEYSRDNPGKATLIAFGVGVGVGLLMANSLVTRNRTKRLVPPVMNALSEIASELLR